jgi:hypothetical protein
VTFYYLSFCDPKLPKGTQFLGATVIEADSIEMVAPMAHLLGRNPGGEIAIVTLPFSSRDESPESGRKYFDRFVPRDEVLAEEHDTLEDDEDMTDAIICAGCNT